jgi:Rrf2 family protein
MMDMVNNFDNKPIRLEDISKRQNLPLQYMQQLFRKLRIAGIIDSVKGNGGGYIIKNKDITVKDVINGVDDSNLIDKTSNETSNKIVDILNKSLENSLNTKIRDLI